jgi:ADP-ribose diphosphatase
VGGNADWSPEAMMTDSRQDEVARSRWFRIVQANDLDEVIVTGGDEVIIVARADQDHVVFIEEPAYAFDTTVLLLPCGERSVGETVLDTAKRELREETGFGARQLRCVAALRPWSRYLKVTTHIVLADDLFEAPLQGDEQHEIIVHRHRPADVLAMAAAGANLDARVIAALALCFRST